MIKSALRPLLHRLIDRSLWLRKVYVSIRSATSSRKVKGHNNRIDAAEAFLLNCKIEIAGNNNRISIGQNTILHKVKVRLLGDNLRFTIGDNVVIGHGSEILMRDNRGNLEIGNDCFFGQVELHVTEDDSQIRIGDGCLFSWEIEVRCSDAHAIFDQESKARINFAENIEIEDHVWVGLRCIILKGAQIGRDAVVGAGCVVAKTIPPNSVAVGNPARVVRSGVV